MYAPHVHKNGKKTKKYKHLILKIGDLDFHEHLDSGDAASPTDSLPVSIEIYRVSVNLTLYYILISSFYI